MIDLVSSMNYILTLGSVYPNDLIVYFSYINYLYIKYHIEAGDIIIIHDRNWTHDMLRYLVKYFNENGYKLVTNDRISLAYTN
jgi:peptidoglycan/xylan/chitin deacetylase (PgdA/CDA1 family)